jgi:hypothetical protein
MNYRNKNDIEISHWNFLMRSFKNMIERILKKMAMQERIIRHPAIPIFKSSTSTKLGTPSPNTFPSNSFLTRASKVYLIGDRYWSHVTQPGYDYAFAKNPPNNKKGITTIGATIDAVSALEKMLERKYPKAAEAKLKRNKHR